MSVLLFYSRVLFSLFTDNEVLRWEESENKWLDIREPGCHVRYHVPWFGVPEFTDITFTVNPELKKWYMDIFEGRVKAKSFSWQCDVGERSNSETNAHSDAEHLTQATEKVSS